MIGRYCGGKEEGLEVGGFDGDFVDAFGQLYTIFIYIEHLHRLVALVRHLVGMAGGKDDVLLAVVLGERGAGRRLCGTSGEARHIEHRFLIARNDCHLRAFLRWRGKEQVEFVLTAYHRGEGKRLGRREAKDVLLAIIARPHNEIRVVGKECVGNEFGRIGVGVCADGIASRTVVAHQVDVVGKCKRVTRVTDCIVSNEAHCGNANGKGLWLVASDAE